jgi:hypothetical protein
MLVTSRPAGLRGYLFEENFHRLQLCPLTEAQQDMVIRQRLVAPQCEDLVQYVRANAPMDAESGLRVTGNPLMLSMYISLFKSRKGGAMPTTTAELYAMASKAMLDRVDRKERGAAAAESSALSLERLLQSIFFEAHVAKQRIIDEEQLLSAALGMHDPERLAVIREETSALPFFEGDAAKGHVVDVISDDERALPYKGRRGVMGLIGHGAEFKVTFPDGTQTGYLKAHQVHSSGLNQTGYEQHVASTKLLRLSVLRAACDALPQDQSDALSSLEKRVAQDRLPLLSLVQAAPLQVQSSHLSFQEFYAARAICSGMALSGPPPWQWEAWWANALRLGREMGGTFGRVLIRAAGVTGDSLDLSKRLGGDRVTACQAVATILADSTSITVVDLRYNSLDSESATILANIAKEKNISLCGIKPEQTEADFTPGSNRGYILNAADAILLAADLTVRPSVTSVRALGNSWSSGECRGSCLLSMLVV